MAERLFAARSRIDIYDALSAIRDAATQQERAKVGALVDAATALLAVCDCVGDDEEPKYGVPKRALRDALAALRGGAE